MSASRLFTLLGASFTRYHNPRLLTGNLVSPFPPIPYVKVLPSLSLRIHPFCSSAAVLETNTSPPPVTATTTTTTTDTANGSEPSVLSNYHPWSEWIAFVDKLKNKGYLNENPAKVSEEAQKEVEGANGLFYTDMNLLKDACLSFARDRLDIFKSLSRQEIQAVVDKGCPNILRKAVNSAKRLRAYLQLDEGDVCSACVLRGSCDRAYVLLKGSEADARTVDIVRILLLYALDPLVTSGGVKTSEREVIEASAKKLLCELIELSETPIDPASSRPAVKVVSQKKQTVGSLYHDNSQNVEMKRGDWICSECNFMNFAKNARCRSCGEDGPRGVRGDDNEMKKGDWVCTECSFMNFARNIQCLKCKAEGPTKVHVGYNAKKIGDWDCPQCAFMNFANKVKCMRCQTPRPKKHEGEWICPSCQFLNFKGNVACKRCNHEAPKSSEKEYDDHIWKKPF